MGGTLKKHQSIALRFTGAGPLKKIVVEGTGRGVIRGYTAAPDLDFSPAVPIPAQIKSALGVPGLLTVVRDQGGTSPYESRVELYSGEIGEDLACYFTESEHIPSAVSVGTIPAESGRGVAAAGGFLVQALSASGGSSSADEELKAAHTAIENLPPMTQMLWDTLSLENIAEKILGPGAYRILDYSPLSYTCSCSKKRLMGTLAKMDSGTISDFFQKENSVNVTCEYCKNVFTIQKADF
jgi:molecular chaperone Hsp33